MEPRDHRLTSATMSQTNISCLKINQSINTSINQPYEPVLPLLGVHQKGKVNTERCLHIHADVVLFPAIKKWNQPCCPAVKDG